MEHQKHTKEIGFHERLEQIISSYPIKTSRTDGSVSVDHVKDSYFLNHETWCIGFFLQINQFKEMVQDSKKRASTHLCFRIESQTVNLEIKYLWHYKLFHDKWSLNTAFGAYATHLNRFAMFLNEKYPDLYSLIDLDIENAQRKWLFWLNERGIKTKENKKYFHKHYTTNTNTANFLLWLYKSFSQLVDNRDEWEKDRWDIRILHDKYGISYNKSKNENYLNFTKIEQIEVRQQVKKYIKQRLLSKNNYSWSTALSYLQVLPKFFSLVFNLEPTWNDLRGLRRSHIEHYIQWLHEYSKTNLVQKNAHPERHILGSLKIIEKFLGDIQRYEYNIAPETSVKLLIFPEDKPKLRKKSIDQIDFIPDFVLEQLFTYINDLHKEVVPVIWIAFKTGLRISDVLGLTSDCLVRLNGKYSIETDIEKTYVKGHRMPIDDELVKILAVLIHQSKEQSNQNNNPEGFIFVRYSGSRKGKPFDQRWISQLLNNLAIKKNIVDENGNLFRFKTHQFRHTFAVKMLNNGVDITTLQELMAHASPEMTLRYARFLDDTKRKAFEKVVKEGVFTFDLNGKIHKISEGEEVPEDIMDMLWRNEKLNAMDNPYGSCRARANGNCPIAVEPPCLTANDGKPCYDLAVGISDMDVRKYELHIESTAKMIEAAKQYGREDMIEANQKNLERYQDIYETIKSGNVIFGRFDRIRRELDKKKGVKHG